MNLWKLVRPLVWAAFHTVSRLSLALSRHRYRYVFILGHMRSGSTLLAHILANHPDFVGAGESHISYQTADDLSKLVLVTCEQLHRPILRETYIVDQINHPYVANEALLSERVYRCIILIREPEATLRSMVKLLKCEEKEALDLYVKRLDPLIQYGLLLRGRAMLVEYDHLIDHTEETLAAITGFFGLNSPLTPNYATHRMTARVPGFGDPSTNIKTGRVVRTSSHDDITISNDTLIAGASAFRKCRDQLQSAMTPSFRPDGAPRPALNE